jgi:hypothetical protein
MKNAKEEDAVDSVATNREEAQLEDEDEAQLEDEDEDDDRI